MAELWYFLFSRFWGPLTLSAKAEKAQILDSCPKSMPKKLGNGPVLDGKSVLYVLLQHYSIIIQYGRNFQNVQEKKTFFPYDSKELT